MSPLSHTTSEQTPRKYKRGEKEAESLEQRRKKFLLINRALIALTMVALAIMIYLWRSGLFDDALFEAKSKIDQELVSSGLVVENIEIFGNRFIIRRQIIEAMGDTTGLPIMEADLYQLSENIRVLPFVKKVSLKRIMPNKLQVAITEYEPEFLWQLKGDIWLITKEGHKITNKNIGRFAHFLHLVGENVPAALDEVMALRKISPEFFDRVKVINRISSRRWDVTLKNGVKIMLPEVRAQVQKPENNLIEVWKKLINFDKEKMLFERQILVIDLRLADKTILRLTPEAAKKRRNDLKEKKKREKAQKI
jgi:cell division protein FtsQ